MLARFLSRYPETFFWASSILWKLRRTSSYWSSSKLSRAGTVTQTATLVIVDILDLIIEKPQQLLHFTTFVASCQLSISYKGVPKPRSMGPSKRSRRSSRPESGKKAPPGKTVFGDHVWWLRTVGSELSQEKFAARAGVHRLDIQRLESGTTKGRSGDMREAIARAIGAPLELTARYLAGDFGQPGKATVEAFLSATAEAPPKLAVDILVEDGRGTRSSVTAALDRAQSLFDDEDGALVSTLAWVRRIEPLLDESQSTHVREKSSGKTVSEVLREKKA